MKLLINLCAHDGIISHNAGVGTMVKRYIETFNDILTKNDIDYHINLITPEYNVGGFGYSESTKNIHENMTNVSIYVISNGTGGKKFFGNIDNWQILSNNAAIIINKINFSDYDYILTLANDTPFAGILDLTNDASNHIKVWIPHSTAKIHLANLLLENNNDVEDRINWENNAINYINSHNNAYLGTIGIYIEKHLVEEYGLNKDKCVFIPNGEILSRKTVYEENEETKSLFEKIKIDDDILLAFGRPEKYKNLDAAMKIAKILNMKSIVITQEYYSGMSYVDYLKELSKETGTDLYVNAPFNFPQYIINHFDKKIILLVPSIKEIAGLVINEIREMNKANVLLVANNIDGLNEQVNDGIDGILVNLDNLKEAATKIKKCFNKEYIQKINNGAQIRLHKDYDFEKICVRFLNSLVGGIHE